MGHNVVARFIVIIIFAVAVVGQRAYAIIRRPINEGKKDFVVVGVGSKHRSPRNTGNSGEASWQEAIAVGGRGRGRSSRKFARIFRKNFVVVVAVGSACGAMAAKI